MTAADEPIAISDYGTALWHRPTGEPLNATYCLYPCAKTAVMTRRVPLSRTRPQDRCRTCWPTPKETP